MAHTAKWGNEEQRTILWQERIGEQAERLFIGDTRGRPKPAIGTQRNSTL